MTLFFYLLFSTSILWAQDNPDPLSFSSQLESSQWTPGQQGKIKLFLKLPAEYHAYTDQFKLEVLEPDGFLVANPNIAPTVDFFDKFSKKTRSGVQNEAVLTALIEAPTKIVDSKIKKFVFQLTYQACAEKFCLFPTKKSFEIPIVFSNATEEKSVSFFSAESFKNLSGFQLFLFVFLAGVLTSFSPCIFPMIPITLAVLNSEVDNRSRKTNFLFALIYVFGIATTYSVLGLVAVKTGALFGASLGNPWVLSTLSILFFVMALSLFGFFEVQLPSYVRKKLHKKHKSFGLPGAYVAGLIAGIVASPCVGPILVGILAFVSTTGDLLKGFFLLFTYAMGLGVLFLLLGASTEFTRMLPKSGPWLRRVQIILGAMMVAVSFYYASLLIPEKHYVSPIMWTSYSESNIKQAQHSKKPSLIDFSADWCAACKQLEVETFGNEGVLSYREKINWIKFDATHDSEALRDLKKLYSIQGLPTIIFLDSNGNVNKDLTLTEFEKPELFQKRLEKLFP